MIYPTNPAVALFVEMDSWSWNFHHNVFCPQCIIQIDRIAADLCNKSRFTDHNQNDIQNYWVFWFIKHFQRLLELLWLGFLREVLGAIIPTKWDDPYDGQVLRLQWQRPLQRGRNIINFNSFHNREGKQVQQRCLKICRMQIELLSM